MASSGARSVRRSRVPSSPASQAMTALSVSISASTWPARTWSPSLTAHEAMLPCDMLGDRAGIDSIVCDGTAARAGARSASWRAQRVVYCASGVPGSDTVREA